MNTETMTVTKGLTELKLLQSRIEKLILETTFVSVSIGGQAVAEHKSTEEFNARAKGNFQAVKDLMRRREAIKRAIVSSNAQAFVEIAGKKFTVAEAIENKNTCVTQKVLLEKLRKDLVFGLKQVASANASAQDRLDQQAQALLGKDNARGSEYENLYKAFMERNGAALVDPLGAQQQIDTLALEVEQFLAEVDHVLSTSNALTTLSIEY